MQVVKDCLINLEELSGLSPNPGKSSLFTCGVDNNTKDSLLGVLGFKEGSLPVRYLGVPLISSKFSQEGRLQCFGGKNNRQNQELDLLISFLCR